MSRAELLHSDWPVGWPSQAGLYEMALRIAHRGDFAMDLSSEAQVRGLQEAAKGKVLTKAWFKRVMRNTWIDKLRGEARFVQPSAAAKPYYEVEVCPASTPEESAIRMEAAERLMMSIEAMPSRQRDVLTLKYFKGKPARAIAQDLNIGEATVEREHKRALERLGTLMEKQRDGFGPGIAVLASATRLKVGKTAKVAGGVFTAKTALLMVAAVCFVSVAAFMYTLVGRGGPTLLDLEGASLSMPSSESGDEMLRLMASVQPASAEVVRAPVATEEEPVVENQVVAAVKPAPQPANESSAPDKAAPTRTFSVRLRMGGRAPDGWSAKEPLLEPDAKERSGQLPPRCVDFARQGEDGLFTFELPEAAGSWTFTFEDSKTWTTLWLIDDGKAGVTRQISFDTGSVLMASPGVTAAGLLKENALLVGNPEPGVWLVSPAAASDPEAGPWHYPLVLAGSVQLKVLTVTHHPDVWKERGEPWTVTAQEVLRVP